MLISISTIKSQIKETRTRTDASGKFGNISYSISQINQKVPTLKTELFVRVSPLNEKKITEMYYGSSIDISLIFFDDTRQYPDFIEVLRRISMRNSVNEAIELESKDSKGNRYKVTSYSGDENSIVSFEHQLDGLSISNIQNTQLKHIKSLYNAIKK
jgi:hypothetical protein